MFKGWALYPGEPRTNLGARKLFTTFGDKCPRPPARHTRKHSTTEKMGNRTSRDRPTKNDYHYSQLTGLLEALLTVPHLEDAVFADEVFGQVVVHGHDVAAPGPPVVVLLRLVLAAGGVRVVAPGVVGVDGAVDAIALCARQRVLVEALLWRRAASSWHREGGGRSNNRQPTG